METLHLKTKYSMEEIEKNFEGVDFFSEIMDGLTEALAHAKGQASANTFTRKRSLPNIDVKSLRGALNMTQRGFADALGVSCRTVEAWESGKANPTPTAKKLMALIDSDHSLVARL